MNISFELVASYIGPISSALAIGFFLFRIKTLDLPAKVLFCLTILSFLTDCITSVLAGYKMNNLMVMHVYTVLELFFYCFFYSLLFKSTSSKYYLLVLSLVLLAAELVDAFYISKLSRINSIASYCEALAFMVVSLLFFYSMIKNLPQKNILNYPLFWFNSGILIYFSGNLFLYLFISFVNPQDSRFLGDLWNINSFLYFAYNLFLIAGAWKSRK